MNEATTSITAATEVKAFLNDGVSKDQDSTEQGETRDRTSNNMDQSSAKLKYLSLILLTVQNALLILVLRYTRTRSGEMYMATSAVIMSELIKLITCLAVIYYEEGCNLRKFLHHLKVNIVDQPIDCLKICVPSFIYILQNNLLYLALSNLDAATFQVTYQLKILTTALFSVLMLRKQLSKQQWIALVILFVGVALVQFDISGDKPDTKIKKVDERVQKPNIGLAAVLISCVMSGFAGVYFEKILKGTSQTLWLRNVQLSSLGVIIGIITMEIKDGSTLKEKGFFNGYDAVVWTVVFLQSFGGLLVAVVVKYADNILKGFAAASAIILSCIASIFFFNFTLTLQFTLGTVLVMISVYIYSKFIPKAPPIEKKSSRTI